MLAPCEYSNLSGISSAEAKNISDLKYVKNAMIQLMLSYSMHEWTIWPGLEYSIFNNAAAIFVGLCISWKLICQTSHRAWMLCASVLRGSVSNAPPLHVSSLKCCTTPTHSASLRWRHALSSWRTPTVTSENVLATIGF